MASKAKIKNIARYGEAGREHHGRAPGSVMLVEFDLDGRPFTALNGGPTFKFSEAVSFQVRCKDQKEVDYYWRKLGAGGDPAARVCGWLKDRFGLEEVAKRLRRDDASEKAGHCRPAEGLRRLNQAGPVQGWTGPLPMR